MATNLDTLIGNVNFAKGPHKNVSTTPIFGGQWVKGEKWPYDLKIVDNTVNKLFEPEQKMKLMPWSAEARRTARWRATCCSRRGG